MRRLRPFAALACVAAAAWPASAQQTNTHIDRYRGSVQHIEDDERASARQVANRFGRCVAHNNMRMAQQALALPLRSEAQDQAAWRVARSQEGCLGDGMDGRLTVHRPLLVGGMAEWFNEERLGGQDLDRIARITNEEMVAIGLAPRGGYEELAFCVVRRDPAGVKAIGETLPSTPEEASAMARVIPYLGPCLPEGARFEFGVPEVRALLAAGLYRMLSVLAVAPGTALATANATGVAE